MGRIEVYDVTKDYAQGLPLVLVIDDEKELLERMTSLLSAEQFVCRCSTTPKRRSRPPRRHRPI